MSKVVVPVSPYYFSSQKRILDVTLCVLVLFISWPILFVMALIILYDSGWPFFFAQKRTGYLKKTFTLYKLRTMKVHPPGSKTALYKKNQAPYPMFKMADDPRYTKIGKFLSRSGIDELPQVINILKGEMSWVGPRPLPVEEAQLLDRDWNFRYRVKPGIISDWAVNPNRYHSLKKWRQLELETVAKGSTLSDLQLMWETVTYLSETKS